jgi:hypothetical protein
MTTRTRIISGLAFVALVAATASAQRFRLPEGAGVGIRFPTRDFRDGSFTHCKLMFTSNVGEPNGMGWSTDYPYAGINLITRVSELTRTSVSLDASGEPNFWVVTLEDDNIFQCPFVMGTDVGTAYFTAAEATRLRNYLLKGGFLWVDDFWGTPAWEQWSGEIHKALPEYRIVDVPKDHPVRRTMFTLDEIPQVTSINMWRRTGQTQERGWDSPHANFRMIANEQGRIMVLMTHNTDIGDSWEREGEDREFFELFSPRGYSLGINVVLYMLTH